MTARRPRSSRLWEERGSATAETAIVLPVVVTMVLVVLLAGGAIGAQVRLESAARGAARELARGEDESAAAAVAERLGGSGTTITVRVQGEWVRVEAHRSLRLGSPAVGSATVGLLADAEARREPQLLDARAGPTGGAP